MSDLSKEQLLDAYRMMRTIRDFEVRVHDEFAKGGIPGFVHLYAGEEASATGICMHLNDQDRISSTHRGHGHCIAKGVDVMGMMAEIYGKETGTCKGKGGSMHIADLDKGMLGANGIVGGGPPLICGVGLTHKIRKTDGVGVAFFGDGASNQGTTLESMNLATVWNLPCIFVVENNGYAEATSAEWSVSCENYTDRAAGFGMPGSTCDGHDFFSVYETAGQAIARARSGGGPSFIEVKLNRYYGHFEGDAQTYRPDNEVNKIKAEKDCLELFRKRVSDAGLLEISALDQIDKEIADLIDDSVKQAEAANEPAAETLLTDVYVSY